MKSGIYKILNKINGKFYIGSAVNLERRWKKHKYELNTQTHVNPYLQKAWNKYWNISFELIVLEYCEKDKLLEREQYWLDFTKCYDDKIGYNILKFSASTFGSKRTDETKAKMSAWQIGRIMSDDARENMRLAKRRISQWTCSDGQKCKCETCKEKLKKYKREWKQRNQGTYISIY